MVDENQKYLKQVKELNEKLRVYKRNEKYQYWGNYDIAKMHDEIKDEEFNSQSLTSFCKSSSIPRKKDENADQLFAKPQTRCSFSYSDI